MCTVTVRVSDGEQYAGDFPYRLAGPMHDEERDEHHDAAKHE